MNGAVFYKGKQYTGIGAPSVEVVPTLTSGVLIGQIMVNGQTYDLYAPDDGGGGGGSEEGTMIAKFTDVTRIGNPMGLSLDVEANFASFTNTDSNNLIPIMTSNSTPRGTASASSIFNSDYDAWKAFDGNTSYWLPGDNDESPYIQYSWGSLTTLSKMIICTYNNGSEGMSKTVTVQGLNASDNWVNCLDTGSNVTLNFGSYKPITYFIDLDGNDYKAIKISGTGDWYVYGLYACFIEAIEVY